MRRSLSIVLLLATLLPLLAPMLALGQDSEAGLPACCRRNGAHHCAMSMAEKSRLAVDDGRDMKWKAPAERCPFCPASVAPIHSQDVLATSPAQVFYAEMRRHPAQQKQTECRWRIARDRSHQKRGPPLSRT